MSREIDAKVAEHVMGFECGARAADTGLITKDCRVFDLPHYSTDISAAFEVVVKLAMPFELTCFEGSWCAQFYLAQYSEHADTAPMAICLAALKAKGVGVGD